MDITISVLIAIGAYLVGLFGFKRVLVALSIISKEHIAMPLASFILWMIIMAIPYVLVNKYLPSNTSSFLIGYFGAILTQYRKMHTPNKDNKKSNKKTGK